MVHPPPLSTVIHRREANRGGSVARSQPATRALAFFAFVLFFYHTGLSGRYMRQRAVQLMPVTGATIAACWHEPASSTPARLCGRPPLPSDPRRRSPPPPPALRLLPRSCRQSCGALRFVR